ncbi:MAG: glycosyltransferase family 2 protein [Desulfobacterales bacterium]|nr:MAG: glycosyltransferase family 2 protein [Desulfobacterales bacterium]
MDRQAPLSAVIITFNEEKNIGRCLDSLRDVADEMLVVDSFSTDRTQKICIAKGARCIQNSFAGHVEQKNYAMQQGRYDCILALDADEALSDELKQSIADAKRQWSCDAYRFNRLTNYGGKWIRHCGWYPDAKIRLWDRSKGQWGGINPHDRVVMEKGSRIGHLAGDLLHFSYPTIGDHLSQINRFSDIAARAAYARGRKSNLGADILLNPAFTFVKKYFIKLGILDGYVGFVISINSAYGKFIKYIKLRELEMQKGPGPRRGHRGGD